MDTDSHNIFVNQSIVNKDKSVEIGNNVEKTLNGKFEILMNEKMNVVVDILENGGWCDNNKHTKIFAP